MTDNQQPSTTPVKGFGWTCSGLLTPRDAANLRRFNAWNIGLALFFAGSTLAIAADLVPNPIGFVLVGLTLVLGIGAIRRYVLFLREADELLRKIQLEAIAIAFGGGIVLMLGWGLLEQLGLPRIEGSLFAAAMLIAWGIGQAVGVRHYAEDVS